MLSPDESTKMSGNKQDDFYYASFKPPQAVQDAHATRTAVANCQYMLPTLLQKAAAKPDLRVLDVGCGPGSITVSLAKYIPGGHIVGVDMSDTVLAKARTLAVDQGNENVSFQTADAYTLPFEDGAFDVVHTHQTVVHLKEHSKAIAELARVTKQGGGIVCMREADMETTGFYPRNTVLEESFQKFIQVNQMQGADCDAGRRLKAWTIAAGILEESIEYSAGTFCYHTPEQRRAFDGARFWEGAMAEKAVELGVANR
jgi:SAM-dependent methyltransferase